MGNITKVQSTMLRITTYSVRLGLEWKNKDLPKIYYLRRMGRKRLCFKLVHAVQRM